MTNELATSDPISMSTAQKRKSPQPRRSLEEDIACSIRDQILSGVIEAGAHLVEANFVRELAVSHGTVRAALRLLTKEGLVEHRARQGMFVISLSPEDILEIYLLRDSLEGLAASLASQKATAADKEELGVIMQALSEAAKQGDVHSAMTLDMDFHCKIVEMSQHRRLEEMYQTIRSQVQLYMLLTEPFYHTPSDLIDNHQPIFNAIVAGDSETAERLSACHNKKDGDELVARLQEGGKLAVKNTGA